MKNISHLFLLITSVLFSQTNNSALVFNTQLFEQLPHVRDISISNNQMEMYFTVESFKKEFSFIAISKKVEGEWGEPQVTSFSGMNKDLEPFLSPDNLKLFFVSNRSIDGNQPKKDMDIWFVERESVDANWSKPINAGDVVNTDKDEFYPAVTISGNLYFTATIEDDTKGKEDIYMSEMVDGSFTKPKSLSTAINSETYEFNAYVSPDESLIIYSSYNRPDGVGGVDLYASKKDENGDWLTAKNLGEKINSKNTDYCPFLDSESEVFYFTSDRSNQKTEFENKMTLNELLSEMNRTPNGLSRIFKLKMNSKLFE